MAYGNSGVLALADGLVSWGGDGAIRFWSLAGEPRPGGDPTAHRAARRGLDPTAHEGGVLGVLALVDGLVSWGHDGAIRFWSLDGEPRPGGDPKAHEGEVWGVLALADGLVSWGRDGVVHRSQHLRLSSLPTQKRLRCIVSPDGAALQRPAVSPDAPAASMWRSPAVRRGVGPAGSRGNRCVHV
jgi:hypothetical protein